MLGRGLASVLLSAVSRERRYLQHDPEVAACSLRSPASPLFPAKTSEVPGPFEIPEPPAQNSASAVPSPPGSVPSGRCV